MCECFHRHIQSHSRKHEVKNSECQNCDLRYPFHSFRSLPSLTSVPHDSENRDKSPIQFWRPANKGTESNCAEPVFMPKHFLPTVLHKSGATRQRNIGIA